jgi:carbon storage regulator
MSETALRAKPAESGQALFLRGLPAVIVTDRRWGSSIGGDGVGAARRGIQRETTGTIIRVARADLLQGDTAMLVLSRQRDESIFIGDNIKITVVDIRGDKVRLGIEAPTEIPVHRQEVYEAIQREHQRAGAVTVGTEVRK